MKRLVLALVGLPVAFAQAQTSYPVQVKAALSKDKIAVGDPVTYTVEVTGPKGMKFDSIPFGANLNGLEVKKDTVMPVRRAQGREVRRAVFEITAFEVDTFTIPPLTIRYRTEKGDGGGEVSSNPVTLAVVSILEADSTRHQLKSEKPPLEIGLNVWPWVLFGLWVLVTAAFIVWVWKKKGAAILEPEVPDLRPAWEIALADLDSLLASPLLEERKLKAFHVRLAEIFRAYAHRMYRFPAEDLTTAEQLEHLKKFLADKEWGLARSFLTFCDLVKFARWEPGQQEILDNSMFLKEIVEATRPASVRAVEAEKVVT
jgi:hypothetical protein